MIIRPQILETKWNGTTKNHYIEKGYKYTQHNAIFKCNIDDLPLNSKVEVKCKCDQCNKIFYKKYEQVQDKNVHYCSKKCARESVRVIVNCAYCNKPIEKEKSKIKDNKNLFCNKKCHSSFMSGKPNKALENKVIVKCYICGKDIEVQPYRLKITKHFLCSNECKSLWAKREEIRAEMNLKTAIYYDVVCDYCGKEFQKQKGKIKGKHHFCDTKCRDNYFIKNNPNPPKEKINVYCEYCNGEIKVFESKAKNNKWHFCSRECYSKFRSESLRGDKVGNYNSIILPCYNCGTDMKVPLNKRKSNKYVFCSFECYQNKRIEITDNKTTKTSIHLKINKLLNANNISYINEKPYSKYSVDIFLKEHSLYIEIMGDYWHSNPNKYRSFKNLNKTQLFNHYNDNKKYTSIVRNGKRNILYLWETDINNNIELCEQLIYLFIQNKGSLLDYQSFNYKLDENKNIQLKPKLLLPYFLNNKYIS